MIKEILEEGVDEKVDALNELRNAYYGMGDHVNPLIEALKYVSKEEAERIEIDVASETKIFKQIQKLFKSSDIGVKL